MWQVIAGFLGGMGLFFMGLRLTGEGVKKIAGRRFRDLFLKWTRLPAAATLLGVISGFIFQSTSGISLILASLIGARVTTVKNALPVLIGANAGVACLVLVAVVDIKVLILCLLGISGLILAFERPIQFKRVAFIAFGVGLLLFGLQTMRTGAAPLGEADWFRAFVANQQLALPWYFVIGIVAGFVLQTAAGVTILAITLASSGILDSNDALGIIFGSLCGTSLLARCYAAQFTGARRRLVMGQVFFNLAGLAIFLPLYILENACGIPLLGAAASRLFPASLPEQLTVIRLSFDASTTLLLTLARPLYNRFLERLCPDAEDGLDSLAYIKELTGLSPETALVLLDKEQDRLVRHFPQFTDRLRQSLDKNACPNVRSLHRTIENLLGTLEECLLDLVSNEQGSDNVNAFALLQGNLSQLRAISETLCQLVEELGVPAASAAMARLRTIFLDALEALLLQSAEVFTSLDAAAWDLFLSLVSDKAPAMDRLRGRYVSEHGELPPDEQWRIMRVTGLYERVTWLLRRLGEQQRRFLDTLSEASAALIRPGEAAPVRPLS
jgi:phosphate:Na+ symporter